MIAAGGPLRAVHNVLFTPKTGHEAFSGLSDARVRRSASAKSGHVLTDAVGKSREYCAPNRHDLRDLPVS